MGKGRNRNRYYNKRKDQSVKNVSDVKSSEEELPEEYANRTQSNTSAKPSGIPRFARTNQNQKPHNQDNTGPTNAIASDHNRRNCIDRKVKFGDRITKFKNRPSNRKYNVSEVAITATMVSAGGDLNAIQRQKPRRSFRESAADANQDSVNNNDNKFENRSYRNINEYEHLNRYNIEDAQNIENNTNIQDEQYDNDNDCLIQDNTSDTGLDNTSSSNELVTFCPGNKVAETFVEEKDNTSLNQHSHPTEAENTSNHIQIDEDFIIVEDGDDEGYDHKSDDESSIDLCDLSSTESNANTFVVNESVKAGTLHGLDEINSNKFEIFELNHDDNQVHENMGQPNSKTRPRKKSQISSNIVIPTITVSDHSHETSEIGTDINNTESEELFYDSTPSFDNEAIVKGFDFTTIPKDISNNRKIDTETESKSSDGNSDEFVLSESDEIILTSDNEFNDNVNQESNENVSASASQFVPIVANQSSSEHIAGIADIVSENLEVSEDAPQSQSQSQFDTIILDKHQADSPDSGIESTTQTIVGCTTDNENAMHINRDSDLFLRDSSTDCDENFLHSDYDTQDQGQGYKCGQDVESKLSEDEDSDDDADEETNYDKETIERPIIIDSISLPDVVVESTTAMGNQSSQSNKSSDGYDDKNAIIIIDHNDNDTRDLLHHEVRYNEQLEDAQKLVHSAQTKVSELQTKIDQLENDLSIKSWNVDRLQAELNAAYKEDECVRKRLKMLEEELKHTKQKFSENEDDMRRKYDELETEFNKLQDKYHSIHDLAGTLQTQLAFAQSDTDQCRAEMEKLRQDKDDEIARLQQTIEDAHEQRKAQEQKWQKEFETLRTQNADQEEHLMADCEWRMRNMQKSCKEKVELAEQAKKEALGKAEQIEKDAQNKMDEAERLKSYQAEVIQLRGLTSDQRDSLLNMTEQLNDIRFELETANQRVEEEIKNVKKMRLQCNNDVSDKDREMMQKIEEARTEVALMWEQKLLDEMTRLKHELESVNFEEKQEALNKLQLEHLEEIKALTNRYDENEKELQKQIQMLREKLLAKAQEFEQLQTKTDNALVKTRMHLERADRDYAQAMERETAKRERLAESMREEFEKEKLEMEESFRIRLNHVKDEFAKELANSADEMAAKHREDLEQQWEQLTNEKEEALQLIETRHRIKIEEAEQRLKDLKIDHQRDMKEMKNNYEIERTTLESRDMQNAHEIEQLHRKCRCLTNLFEEMRMRYERRDPRPEDLREISDLRSRCEAQERDLQNLNERLRQIQLEAGEEPQVTSSTSKKSKIRKPPPKQIPITCDVIYEENEELDSSAGEVSTNGILEDSSETLL